MTAHELPAATTLGAVHLSVSDLARSLAFYREAIGLEALGSDGDGGEALGAGGRTLLVISEAGGSPAPPGRTGLYHFALLVPGRVDLARWLAHAIDLRVPLAGAADHFVSEALYLSDPDGHGIEIYWDRPRAVWQGQVAARMGTEPLDVRGLLGELGDGRAAASAGLPDPTTIGHVHLRVAELDDTIAFYRDLLGFGLMAQLGQRAAFFAAGGYHHHIGANTWESAGGSPVPAGSPGLRHLTLVLPGEGARDHVLGRLARAGHRAQDTDDGPLVRDPSGNALVLARA